MLATRQGVRLGLHRLRLEGELTEIRGGDLRFSLAEARELFGAAGVELPEQVLGIGAPRLWLRLSFAADRLSAL